MRGVELFKKPATGELLTVLSQGDYGRVLKGMEWTVAARIFMCRFPGQRIREDQQNPRLAAVARREAKAVDTERLRRTDQLIHIPGLRVAACACRGKRSADFLSECHETRREGLRERWIASV